MPEDSLYRVSFKCLILNKDGRVLVVKEHDRLSWEIPGGGIEYGETIEESIARELFEEVSYKGNFEYKVLKIHNPGKLLSRDIWQIRIVLLIRTNSFDFSAGDDADEIKFINPEELRYSDQESESSIYEYLKLASVL